MLVHRIERRAELVALDDPAGAEFGSALCEVHLERVKVPSGWTTIDRPAQIGSVRVLESARLPRFHLPLDSPLFARFTYLSRK